MTGGQVRAVLLGALGETRGFIQTSSENGTPPILLWSVDVAIKAIQNASEEELARFDAESMAEHHGYS